VLDCLAIFPYYTGTLKFLVEPREQWTHAIATFAPLSGLSTG
jgi:hypothetical protein